MNWSEGPATWKQLRYLSQCGYKPDRPLTKTEASDLIRNFGGQPENFVSVSVSAPAEQRAQIGPENLREAVQAAHRAMERADHQNMNYCREAYDSAIARRQQFWADTCREAGQMRQGSKVALELYRKHGCLFREPALFQVQQVLDALDSALASWDRDHPELFYETLGLNFPALLRHR